MCFFFFFYHSSKSLFEKIPTIKPYLLWSSNNALALLIALPWLPVPSESKTRPNGHTISIYFFTSSHTYCTSSWMWFATISWMKLLLPPGLKTCSSGCLEYNSSKSGGAPELRMVFPRLCVLQGLTSRLPNLQLLKSSLKIWSQWNVFTCKNFSHVSLYTQV